MAPTAKNLKAATIRKATVFVNKNVIDFGAHKFHEHTSSKPIFCCNCKTFKWGMKGTEVYMCSGCGLISHESCIKCTPEQCEQMDRVKSSVQKPHNFEKKSLMVPMHCNVCETMTVDVLGMVFRCKGCKMLAHEKCLSEVPQNCGKNVNEPRGRLLMYISACDSTFEKGRGNLKILVEKGKNLPQMDCTGLADPYVKILTDGADGHKICLKTSIKKNTLTPEWNETIEIDVDTANPDLKITVEVWDYDTLSPDDFIGSFSLTLKDIENYNYKFRSWYKLFDKTIGNQRFELIYDDEINSEFKNDVVKSYLAHKMTKSMRKTKIISQEREFPDYLEPQKVIASGSFASVCLAYHKNIPVDTYAVKMIKKTSFNARLLKYFKQEMICMTQFDFPFIIKAFACHPLVVYLGRTLISISIQQNVYVVMEFCKNGSLFERITNEDFNEKMAIFCMAEIILGLEYIHAKNYLHRDIKPENILIDSSGHLKIADFGFASPLNEVGKCLSSLGSPYYVSPEILMQKPYSFSVDFWAGAVVFYVMVEGAMPFSDATFNSTYKKIKEGSYSPTVTMSSVSRDYVKKSFIVQEESRIGCGPQGINEIKKHQIFKHVNWRDLLDGKVKSPLAVQHNSIQGKGSCEITQSCLPDVPHHNNNTKYEENETWDESEFEDLQFIREGFVI